MGYFRILLTTKTEHNGRVRYDYTPLRAFMCHTSMIQRDFSYNIGDMWKMNYLQMHCPDSSVGVGKFEVDEYHNVPFP